MIASAYQRPPHIYGEILSASVYQSPRSDLPSIGRFLLQGAAVGPLIAFFWPVAEMLLYPENGWNFLLLLCLPMILGGGILFGLCEGVTIWTCTYLLGRRINPVARAVLGMVTLVIPLLAYDFVFTELSPYNRDHSVTDYLYALWAVCGLVFGLVIGSKFRPHYELIRGTSTDRWPGLSGVTGLLLRIFVIFSLMVSILCLILSTQGDFDRKEFTFSVIAVSHFALAVVIIFARIPFWLLLPLAIIVNFPIVVFVTDALPNVVGVRVLTLVYLHLWAAFLLCRLSVPQRPLSFLKKEVRYYLIDWE